MFINIFLYFEIVDLDFVESVLIGEGVYFHIQHEILIIKLVNQRFLIHFCVQYIRKYSNIMLYTIIKHIIQLFHNIKSKIKVI
jgi:hypothetical protein